jgi:hypothetical protein
MFFRQFPKVNYLLPNGYSYRIPDITRYSNLNFPNLDSISYYQFYDIKDGERPDIVSSKLYQIPDYYWTFFLLNNHLKNGYGGWPMSYQELERHVSYEYEGVAIQTRETFWDSSFIKLGQKVTIEGNESVTGVIRGINSNLNQIIIKDTNLESRWITSEGSNLVPINYDSSSERLTIQKSTPHKYGLSHYENEKEQIVPITYGINYNFSQETDGSIYEINDEILYPISFLDRETKLNDGRSKIKVIKKSYIFEFSEKFREAINAN